MNAIYLDINDRFFRDKPLAGEYPVSVRVLYWDGYTGNWELQYDAINGVKTALEVQNEGTNRWVEKTVILNDAHFENQGVEGSDIALINTSNKKCLFHMVEVLRVK